MASDSVGHGSDFHRFLQGEWTRCICGYDPRDNMLLIVHFEVNGFKEVDDHGHIVRIAVP